MQSTGRHWHGVNTGVHGMVAFPIVMFILLCEDMCMPCSDQTALEQSFVFLSQLLVNDSHNSLSLVIAHQQDLAAMCGIDAETNGSRCLT